MEDIDNLTATELTLGLPGTVVPQKPKCKKRSNLEFEESCEEDDHMTEHAAKAQVVGWPPVRTSRISSLKAKKMEFVEDNCGLYVKVSMDGAPYLRKVDLKMHKGYKDLKMALEKMFMSFSLGCDESEFAIAYEDKEGDWMLVGDVPFEMFISSCKRLRIMNGSEAKGLTSNV